MGSNVDETKVRPPVKFVPRPDDKYLSKHLPRRARVALGVIGKIVARFDELIPNIEGDAATAKYLISYTTQEALAAYETGHAYGMDTRWAFLPKIYRTLILQVARELKEPIPVVQRFSNDETFIAALDAAWNAKPVEPAEAEIKVVTLEKEPPLPVPAEKATRIATDMGDHILQTLAKICGLDELAAFDEIWDRKMLSDKHRQQIVTQLLVCGYDKADLSNPRCIMPIKKEVRVIEAPKKIHVSAIRTVPAVLVQARNKTTIERGRVLEVKKHFEFKNEGFYEFSNGIIAPDNYFVTV